MSSPLTTPLHYIYIYIYTYIHIVCPMTHWSVCHRLYGSEWFRTTWVTKALLRTVLLPSLIVRPIAFKTLHTPKRFKRTFTYDVTDTQSANVRGNPRRQETKRHLSFTRRSFESLMCFGSCFTTLAVIHVSDVCCTHSQSHTVT